MGSCKLSLFPPTFPHTSVLPREILQVKFVRDVSHKLHNVYTGLCQIAQVKTE